MTKNKVQKNIPETQTIEKSLELSIVDDNLKNLTIDMVELSIDSLLDDGILKDLPVVGSFARLYSVGVNVQDKLFLKKILSFLNQLKDIPQNKRNRMLEKINRNGKYRIKVGEKLLYILDSCNDYENSERVGIVFKFFIKGKITRLEFEKISFILSAINNNDFLRVIKTSKKLKDNKQKRNKKQYFEDKIFLNEVSDLLYLGIFNILYTEPIVSIDANDYSDGYKSSPINEYVASVDEDIQGYIELNNIGETLVKIFNKEL